MTNRMMVENTELSVQSPFSSAFEFLKSQGQVAKDTESTQTMLPC